MPIEFKLRGETYPREVKYVYAGASRVAKICFVDPETENLETPYILKYIVDSSGVSNGRYSGPSTINYGQSVYASIIASAGYYLPSEITVTGDDEAAASYNCETGRFALANINRGVTTVEITALCSQIIHNITKSATFGTVTGPAYISEGSGATLTFTPYESYYCPKQVTVNGQTGTSGTQAQCGVDWTYDRSTGSLRLTNAITDITVSGVCVLANILTIVVTNGTHTEAPTEIEDGGSAAFRIIADDYCTLPSSISASGDAEFAYNATLGSVSITDVYSDVVVVANCSALNQLIAPTISLDDSVVTIVDMDGNTTHYEIYADGVLQTTIAKTS